MLFYCRHHIDSLHEKRDKIAAQLEQRDQELVNLKEKLAISRQSYANFTQVQAQSAKKDEEIATLQNLLAIANGQIAEKDALLEQTKAEAAAKLQ